MIPSFRPQPLGSLIAPAETTALVGFQRHTQSLLLPNPMHSLVVDLPTIPAQLTPYRAATGPLFLPRQLQDFLPQRLVLVSAV